MMLLISLPILSVSSLPRLRMSWIPYLGVVIWMLGFGIESLADNQLKRFISDPLNKGRIMRYQLWKYSRHPNYLGEITQWWGIGVIALNYSYGWVGLIGPLMITFLIVRVSGVPLLEKKYANNPEYWEYKLQTHTLLLLPIKKR